MNQAVLKYERLIGCCGYSMKLVAFAEKIQSVIMCIEWSRQLCMGVKVLDCTNVQ